MKTRKVVVADSLNSLIETEVDADRCIQIADGLRSIPGLFGSPNDIRSILGRRPSANDATEAFAFTVGQLAYTEATMYERYYQPMQYTRFVPVSYEAGPEATSVDIVIEDRVGAAQWADSLANDTPTADVSYARSSFPIHHGKAGYEFSQQELRQSAFLRRPLPESRLKTAIEAYQRKLNSVGLLGDTAKNLTGLYNNANVTAAATTSGKAWVSTTTVAEILNDFNVALYNQWAASGYNVVADTLILPALAYQYINSTPASPTIPTITILQYMKENNLCVTERGKPFTIAPGFDLATAGSGGVTRAVLYDNSPMTVKFHVPMALQFLAPQLQDVMVKVPGEFRASGVVVMRPTNMRYIDGT